MTEMKSPDFATIQATVAGEQWALDKVLECYGDEINRLSTVRKRQPDGSIGNKKNRDAAAIRQPPRPGFLMGAEIGL